jgi:transcription antitermination factor NusG
LKAVQNEAKDRWDSNSGSSALTTGCRPLKTLPPQLHNHLPQWFAIEIRHRFEKKVVAQLDGKGFRNYLPVLTEQHSWSDRPKKITYPLFPGYAFVSADESRASGQAILQTNGVIRFVTFAGIAAAIPNKQIDDLQLLLKQKGKFSLHPFVRSGQRVRIREGCLRGLEGILMQNDKNKLVISIQSIERSLAIEIQGYEIELA